MYLHVTVGGYLKRIPRRQPETSVSKAATRVTVSGALLWLRAGSYQYHSPPVPPIIPIRSYPSSSRPSNQPCCNKGTLAVYILDRQSLTLDEFESTRQELGFNDRYPTCAKRVTANEKGRHRYREVNPELLQLTTRPLTRFKILAYLRTHCRGDLRSASQGGSRKVKTRVTHSLCRRTWRQSMN